ncbi:hypothetical protein TNCV_1171751 [Trichonephila clavipes]|uniref:Uncharacterized protein n=1 Tax=Trichonephila clavipes TaxID=2585209 RepID=A0A8X6VEK7_TRICX|nr:hypothetical protein TNCV_1171751 [Trichonephila clavipes]
MDPDKRNKHSAGFNLSKPIRDDSSVSSEESLHSAVSSVMDYMPSTKEPETLNASSVKENSPKTYQKFGFNASAVFSVLTLTV